VISFTILAQNRAQLDAQLIVLGIAKWEGKGQDRELTGVKPGLEIMAVPNSIIITAAVGDPMDPGYVPPVYHSDEAFMVKLAYELAAFDDSGDATAEDDPHPGWTRSNLVKAIKAENRPETTPDLVVRHIKDPAQYEADTIDPISGDTLPGAKLPDTYTTVRSPLRTYLIGATLRLVDKRDDDILGSWQ